MVIWDTNDGLIILTLLRAIFIFYTSYKS